MAHDGSEGILGVHGGCWVRDQCERSNNPRSPWIPCGPARLGGETTEVNSLRRPSAEFYASIEPAPLVQTRAIIIVKPDLVIVKPDLPAPSLRGSALATFGALANAIPPH
jgi:hypothetical protein